MNILIRLLTRVLRGWMRAAYLKRYFELRLPTRTLKPWLIVHSRAAGGDIKASRAIDSHSSSANAGFAVLAL